MIETYRGLRGGWNHYLEEVTKEVLFKEVRFEIKLLKRSEHCREVREEHCRWSAESPGQNKCGGRRHRTKARWLSRERGQRCGAGGGKGTGHSASESWSDVWRFFLCDVGNLKICKRFLHKEGKQCVFFVLWGFFFN